tara:strand:- start:2011 stop:2433 length:423 start_codon:yes stop_codon:yes gene_type:complete
MQPILTLTDAPDNNVERVIGAGLAGYNLEKAGLVDNRALAVLLTEPETGELLGGLSGRTSLGLLFIDIFHVPAMFRGTGIGSRIIKMAEDEARARGCAASFLVTINFQAPAFYQRHGYEEFGRIETTPDIYRVFMRKILA